MDDETVDQQEQSAQQPTPAPAQPAAPAQQPVSAQQPAPAQAAAPAIKPVTPVRRGGLAGIIDEFRDAISGTSSQSVHQDADGNKYIKTDDLSGGQRWLRVIGTGIRGAAAGMAAGRGPGGTAKAFEAGLQAGDKQREQRQEQAKEQNEEVKQQQLEKFNAIKQQHDLAAQNFEMTRRQIAASRADMEFAQQQLNQELKPRDQGGYGSIDLGTAKDYKEFADRMQATRPDFWRQVYAGDGHNVKQYPEFDESGKQVGIHVVLRTEDVSKQPAPQGATFKRFIPGEKAGELGHLEDVTPSGMHTVGELETWTNAALSQQNQERITAANLADKQALANQRNSAAGANDARAENLQNGGSGRTRKPGGTGAGAGAGAGAGQGAGTPNQPAHFETTGNPHADALLQKWPEEIQTSVRGLVNYQTSPDTFPPRKYAKSGQMDRETAVGLAQMIDPTFSEKLFKSRQAALIDFTSPKGKAGGNIVALNTAVQHLDKLNQDIDALQNGNFQGWNAAKNWVNTTVEGKTAKTNFETDRDAVANEMATVFKGTGATDQEIKAWRENMSAAESPQQLHESMQHLLGLMSGRLNALNGMYSAAMGRNERSFTFLNDSSRQILHRLGADEMVKTDSAYVKQPQQQAAPQQQQAPAPQTHQFSVSAWQQANPHGDVNAAKALAQQQGYQVVQ